jgi:hypothetical protein
MFIKISKSTSYSQAIGSIDYINDIIIKDFWGDFERYQHSILRDQGSNWLGTTIEDCGRQQKIYFWSIEVYSTSVTWTCSTWTCLCNNGHWPPSDNNSNPSW